MIAIIDYDIGNLGAVASMLHRVGASTCITADPAHIAAADGIVLPGNGAFDACMRNLQASGLIPLLERLVLGDRRPLLGICVGAQMLGHGSEEGQQGGLGWLDFDVRRFPDAPDLRVPHMGWNEVQALRPEHPLLRGLEQPARFYFVHSYYMAPRDPSLALLGCNHGIDFAAAVARDRLAGVQFHPEKSHRFGKRLLANFVELVRCCAPE